DVVLNSLFFFSSRRRHTRCYRDWSSDVCSSDLFLTVDGKEAGYVTRAVRIWDPSRVIGMGYVRREASAVGSTLQWAEGTATVARSEERRVGKGGRSGRAACDEKKRKE